MRELKLSGKLAAGRVALVDDQDYDELTQYSWSVCTSGYARRRDGCKHMMLHRHLVNPDATEHVAHLNGDRLDNRRDNLKATTPYDCRTCGTGTRVNGSPLGLRLLHNGSWKARVSKGKKEYTKAGRDRQAVEDWLLAKREELHG